MSITSQIELALQGIDQATFQKMMNHILFLDGNKFLGSPGSVVGKDKTSKGSPDSFFEYKDDYVFVEYTTQERLPSGTVFLKKLEDDINHCFDEEKTGITKNKIAKVILGFTDKISVDEHTSLKEQVKKHNPAGELLIYSIENVAFKILYYPGLSDRYLGIPSTKGAIYTLPDFLVKTGRGIQPSLNNPFLGREEEIEQIVSSLTSEDILILSGSAGVGKSKLAVHIAEKFEADNAFEILYQPLQVYSVNNL